MASMTCHGIPAPQEVSIFSSATCCVMAILTTAGNAAIVFVVYKDPFKKLRTPFMYFVVNLAVADLIVGCFYFPVGIYVFTSEALGKLNEPSAEALHISFFISVTASILSLIALTVDRYIAITFPLKHKKYLTWKRCLSMTGVIWFLALTIPFGYFEAGYVDYLMVDSLASIILALIIYIITYIRIYRHLREQTRRLKEHTNTESEEFQLRRLRQEKKITKVFLLVLLLFMATYGPAAIMILILKFCPNCDCYFRHWLRDLILVFISVNSCMNPFVYTARLKTFRKSLIYLMKKYRGKDRSDTTDAAGDNQRRMKVVSNKISSSSTQLSSLTDGPDDNKNIKVFEEP